VPAVSAPLRRGQSAGPIHIVKSRETVGGIAKRYGISVADLFRWNGLDGSARIRPGDRLRLNSERKQEGNGVVR
jgi:membrane-bound lytic murein transglycosylase D